MRDFDRIKELAAYEEQLTKQVNEIEQKYRINEYLEEISPVRIEMKEVEDKLAEEGVSLNGIHANCGGRIVSFTEGGDYCLECGKFGIASSRFTDYGEQTTCFINELSLDEQEKLNKKIENIQETKGGEVFQDWPEIIVEEE